MNITGPVVQEAVYRAISNRSKERIAALV